MTVVGADSFEDAPLIELGTSSAYTPNAGYSTESGEPSAWGGRTAWWKYVAAQSQFVYVDVLHSTGGPVRSWSYRADGPDFSDLLQLSAPAAGAQGGFNANAGSTYYIRIDSDGSDASYVLSVGADVYDYHTERRNLTDPTDADSFYENHFSGTGLVTGPGEATSIAILVDNAQSGDPDIMDVESYATETVEQYPTYAEVDWYTVNPGNHPTMQYRTGGQGAVSAPAGFELLDATLKAAIWSTAGPDLAADSDGEVVQVRLAGPTGSFLPVFYFDDVGGVAGDVPTGVVGFEHSFALPPTLTASQAEFFYNGDGLRFEFLPNISSGDFPAGAWFVGAVAVEFLYQSEEPVPYVPPGPPEVLLVPKLRLYPRDDTLGFSGIARNYPPPRRTRNYGNQP